MPQAKTLKRGDPCPVNGLPMVKAAIPTAEEYAAFSNKENPVSLSPMHDTASPADRAELGELYIEPVSGYRARFPVPARAARTAPAPAAPAAAPEAAQPGDADG